MGFGDVKLAGVLGWRPPGSAGVPGGRAFAGFLLGGLGGGVLLPAGGGRKSRVPFGPFMLAGALVGVLVGDRLAAAYLG